MSFIPEPLCCRSAELKHSSIHISAMFPVLLKICLPDFHICSLCISLLTKTLRQYNDRFEKVDHAINDLEYNTQLIIAYFVFSFTKSSHIFSDSVGGNALNVLHTLQQQSGILHQPYPSKTSSLKWRVHRVGAKVCELHL